MKTQPLFYLTLVLCLSCQKDDIKAEIVLRIKENKVSCTGYEGQTECYLVQQGDAIDTEVWEYFYEDIDGFDYEPGYLYKLLVAKESIKNPPMDAPRIKYTLIKVISMDIN